MKWLRNKLGVGVMLIGLMIMAPGCTTAKLPDPTIVNPTPPAVLMEPSRNMNTIGEAIDNSR